MLMPAWIMEFRQNDDLYRKTVNLIDVYRRLSDINAVCVRRSEWAPQAVVLDCMPGEGVMVQSWSKLALSQWRHGLEMMLICFAT